MGGAPEDLRIVPAPRSLLPEILRCSRETFEEHRARQPWAFPANSFEVMIEGSIKGSFREGGRTLAESPNLFAAYRGEDFAGYVLLSVWARQDVQYLPYVGIDDICVLPEFRRKGIARALLRHAVALSEERGWDSLKATVWAGNDASDALFRSEGFAVESTKYRTGPDRQCRDYPEAKILKQVSRLWSWGILLAAFCLAWLAARR